MTLRRGGSLMVLVVALITLVPVGSAGVARGLPAAGCEPIAVTAAPGIPELSVRRATECRVEVTAGTELVATPEGVWANTADFSGLQLLDPVTLRVTARVAAPYVQGIIVRDDGLWALSQHLERVDNRDVDLLDLYQIDRRTHAVVRTIRVPISATHSSDDQAYLAATRDRLWVTLSNAGVVAAISPTDGSTIAAIPLGGRAEAIAGNDTTLWVELWLDDHTGTSQILAVDAATNTIASSTDCACGGIGRSSKMVATNSDVWFSGSALTHLDPATGTIVTEPRRFTGGLATTGSELWAIGPTTLTTPTAVDTRPGLVTRFPSGTNAPFAGTVVTLRPKGDFLGPLATDGGTIYAVRNRYFPAGDRAPRLSIVRLTLAR